MPNELYAHLSDEVRQELAKHEQTVTVPGGTILVQCGAPSDGLVILDTGSAETSVPDGNRTFSLGVSGPGKVFGLHSILCGEASHTNVTCLQECAITVLAKEAFLDVLRRNPQIYFPIAKILSADLATAHGIIRDHSRNSNPKSGPKPPVKRAGPGSSVTRVTESEAPQE